MGEERVGNRDLGGHKKKHRQASDVVGGRGEDVSNRNDEKELEEEGSPGNSRKTEGGSTGPEEEGSKLPGGPEKPGITGKRKAAAAPDVGVCKRRGWGLQGSEHLRAPLQTLKTGGLCLTSKVGNRRGALWKAAFYRENGAVKDWPLRLPSRAQG